MLTRVSCRPSKLGSGPEVPWKSSETRMPAANAETLSQTLNTSGQKKSAQTLFAQSFSRTLRVMDVRAENHGRPQQTVRFPATPVMGRNLLDPWASGRKGQECPQENRTEKFICMVYFFPHPHTHCTNALQNLAAQKSHHKIAVITVAASGLTNISQGLSLRRPPKNRRKRAATTAASRRSRAISWPQRPQDTKLQKEERPTRVLTLRGRTLWGAQKIAAIFHLRQHITCMLRRCVAEGYLLREASRGLLELDPNLPSPRAAWPALIWSYNEGSMQQRASWKRSSHCSLPSLKTLTSLN